MSADESPIHILLVDDHPQNLMVLEGALEQEGYVLAKAQSGREALRQVLNHDFAAILLDIQMPEMDGFETARLIRQRPRSQSTPILFLTAYGQDDKMISQAYASGAVDYLFKPFSTEILRAKVAVFAELFSKRRELEETNRKLKETQSYLVQSEKMASLGQLVAGIAHEINNPLAFVLNNVFTISGSLKWIAQETAPHLTGASLKKLEKAQTRLGEMKEGLERVKELVLKLRTFSRLDEGDFKTVDVHEGLEAVLLFLRHRMKGRIQAERNYCADGTLSCYAGQLNQVFMNLIANAVEAIEGQGKITITTCRDGENFIIAVRDTGRGIPETLHHRIFEPFFTTKPVGQGTGLGLAISYSIVQAHQGTIEALSQEEQGTEFLVKIPLGLKEETRS